MTRHVDRQKKMTIWGDDEVLSSDELRQSLSNIKELIALLFRRCRLIAVSVECAVGDGTITESRLEAVEIVFVDNVEMITSMILVFGECWLVHFSALILGVNARYITLAESHTLSNRTLIEIITCDQRQLTISRRRLRSVVHNRVIIVSCAIIVVHRRINFIELAHKARLNVLPQNLHVLVAIGSIVHVNEAERVKKLVHDDAFREAFKSVE